MSRHAKTCACGEPKGFGNVVCVRCWGATDMALRRALNLGYTEADRRAAAREIIAAARARRPVVAHQIEMSL